MPLFLTGSNTFSNTTGNHIRITGINPGQLILRAKINLVAFTGDPSETSGEIPGALSISTYAGLIFVPTGDALPNLPSDAPPVGAYWQLGAPERASVAQAAVPWSSSGGTTTYTYGWQCGEWDALWPVGTRPAVATDCGVNFAVSSEFANSLITMFINVTLEIAG